MTSEPLTYVVLILWVLSIFAGREFLTDHWKEFPSFSQVIKFVFFATLIAVTVSMCLWCAGIVMNEGQFGPLAWWQAPFAVIGFIIIFGSVISVALPVLIAMMGCCALVASWMLLLFYPIAKKYRSQLGFC